ncbi:hypothetical protein F5883DRAFT_525255 [Diaporthe sp. PMI_573]|nr:hypothetical protein F5883DRAFT_525255 [Diaporthaceae sp. PMI_573]
MDTNTMRLFQVGFEVIRLPQDRNLSTQTMVEKMNANANGNTNDSTAGIRVGIGGSYVLQVASSVCSNPAALASMVSVFYMSTNAQIMRSVLHTITTTPTVHHRPMLAFIGTMMAGTGAFAATMLLKLNDNRRARVRAPEPKSESFDATNSESL